jgi:hypothetical protein
MADISSLAGTADNDLEAFQCASGTSPTHASYTHSFDSFDPQQNWNSSYHPGTIFSCRDPASYSSSGVQEYFQPLPLNFGQNENFEPPVLEFQLCHIDMGSAVADCPPSVYFHAVREKAV